MSDNKPRRNQLAAGILAVSAIVGGWVAGSYIDGTAVNDPPPAMSYCEDVTPSICGLSPQEANARIEQYFNAGYVPGEEG